MRDCIYGRSKAAATALVEISVRISIVRPNSLNSNGAIMYMLPAAKRAQIPAVSLIRNRINRTKLLTSINSAVIRIKQSEIV